MKLTSQRLGNTNLLLVINLLAFVLLLNLLLFFLQSDTRKLSSDLSALRSEVTQQTAKVSPTKIHPPASSLKGVYFFTTSAMLPSQPINCFVIFWGL